MDKCQKTSILYLVALKAISFIHQHNHWIAKGSNFYGDHLLFERLYKSANEDMDLAAEKFVGLFGEECLNYEAQAVLLSEALLKYKGLAGVAMSERIERDFLKFSSVAYKLYEDEGQLTLGLDDMIMSIASNRESSVYLLQQTNKK